MCSRKKSAVLLHLFYLNMAQIAMESETVDYQAQVAECTAVLETYKNSFKNNFKLALHL